METNRERIQKDIEALAEFTASEEGCTRFTYTEEFKKARNYIISQMKTAGLDVRENAAGTIIGRLEGKNPSAPVIMTGSHFDSVKCGGNFDGQAGVAAALETARVFKETGYVPERTVEFVALPEEEGARFNGGLFGSRSMAGRLYGDEVHEAKDKDGISMAEAMKEYGLDPENMASCIRKQGEIEAFLELHIEQGPILEKEGFDIGIVDCIVGIKSCIVVVEGRPDHAGTTPMNMRADSFQAAAKAAVAGADRAKELGDGTVFTVGRVETAPGAFNIVPGRTEFTIDCRSKNPESIESCLHAVRDSLEASCSQVEGISYRLDEKLKVAPVQMDEELKKVLKESAEQSGFSYREILSGAGHDAMVMADIARVAMVFTQSREGRSHCPQEWTDYELLQKGIEVICQSVKELSSR